MDNALAIEKAASIHQKSINETIDRGDSFIQNFYRDTTIFLTGGSGFIGKQLIEKLFRSCKIEKLYVLIRSKKGKGIEERFAEMMEDPIFEGLRRLQPKFEERIVPIEGDVAAVGLGIEEQGRSFLCEEVEIIFHSAATIAFDAPLQSAALTNIRGTRELINLAKHCKKLKSFVHLSTAYCHATSKTARSQVLEQFYPCPMNPELMIQLAETLDKDRLNDMKKSLIQDWPNTYSFTKALAEDLIRTDGKDLPISIVRPSIVICTERDPLPGWVDKNCVLGASGLILGCMMAIVHVLFARQEIRLDLVPVDYVCNTSIAAATTAVDQPLKIYQVATSCRNHITWAYLSEILREKARTIVPTEQAVGYCFVLQPANRIVYRVLKNFFHEIPAYVLDGFCVLFRKSARFKKIYSLFNKLASVLEFYMTNDWIFNDGNTAELYRKLSIEDKTMFYHEVQEIKWQNMILLWCVGLRRYVVKDGLKNTKLGQRRQKYFKIGTVFLIGLLIYCFLMLIYYFFKLIR